MVIHLDLTTVPESCWWWTGAISYLLLCYLVLAPIITRHKVVVPPGRYHPEWNEEMVILFWLCSPVALPFYYVITVFHVPFCRLIYGSSK